MSVPPRAVQLNEANAFLKDHPEVLYVDLLIADMNGVVRGKRIERTSLHKVYEKGINLPASLFALDINGSTVESTGLGLDIGDADRICYPIPDTLCNEPWQKRPTVLETPGKCRAPEPLRPVRRESAGGWFDHVQGHAACRARWQGRDTNGARYWRGIR